MKHGHRGGLKLCSLCVGRFLHVYGRDKRLATVSWRTSALISGPKLIISPKLQ